MMGYWSEKDSALTNYSFKDDSGTVNYLDILTTVLIRPGLWGDLLCSMTLEYRPVRDFRRLCRVAKGRECENLHKVHAYDGQQ